MSFFIQVSRTGVKRQEVPHGRRGMGCDGDVRIRRTCISTGEIKRMWRKSDGTMIMDEAWQL